MLELAPDMVFCQEIDELIESLDVEYIDAVVMWCEKNGVELETAGSWIKKNARMRSQIQIEAENLNYLKKTARLPI